MAKVLTDAEGVTHLRGADRALCGITDNGLGHEVTDGVLTCPNCAAIALRAVELVTKAEKREWRQL